MNSACPDARVGHPSRAEPADTDDEVGPAECTTAQQPGRKASHSELRAVRDRDPRSSLTHSERGDPNRPASSRQNDVGIDVPGLGHFIIKNTASGNGQNYDIHEFNEVGSIKTTPVGAGAWDNFSF